MERGLFLLPILVCPLLFAQAPKPKTATASLVPDVQEVIFYAENKPIRVFLHIATTDGSLNDKFLEKLRGFFQFLDRDGDGFLNKEEAEFAFSNKGLQSLIESGYAYPSPNDDTRTFDKFDANKDGKISFEEFTAYYAPCAQFFVSAKPMKNGDNYAEEVTSEIFKMLDTNTDGKLSRQEVAVLPSWIEKYDRDEDDCLSITEIIPDLFTKKDIAAKNESSAFGSLRIQRPGEFSESAIETLMLRYDRNKNLRLKPNEIAFDPETFKKLDRNGDGMLSMFELVEWRNLPPDLEIEIRLGKTMKESKVALKKRADGSDYPLAKQTTTGPNGNLLVKVGSQTIDFGVLIPVESPAPALPPNENNDLMAAFTKAAGSKDHVVDKDLIGPEFQHLRILFDMADRNGDGKVTKPEMLALIKLFESFRDSPLHIAYNVETPSLFRALDQNRDGRLSLRELRQAWERLRPLEPGEGDYLTPNIFRPQAKVYLTRELDVERYAVVNPYQVNLNGDGRGPAWFRKLDRNGDGDISLKEFPGRKDEFDRLDLDGDGLISLEEAEAAEVRYRKK